MPKYKYVVKTKEGQRIKDTEDANTAQELIVRLRARGLFIISVKKFQPLEGGFSFATIFGGQRRKHKSAALYDLTLFARNLSVTLSSGVTLLRSLEILANQTESIKLEEILRSCAEDIKGGASLYEAIARHPQTFSHLWRGIIEMGEASGNLPMVLEKLADYLELRVDFERKVKSALIYPVILCVVAVIVIFAFLKFILPRFALLFDQLNVELPLSTRIVFGLGRFVGNNFFILFLGGAAAIFLVLYARKQPEVRSAWDRISLQLPILGKIMMLFSLERFTSTIYILLDSGLPLVYTLEVAARAIGNSFLERAILAVKERVREGGSLSEEFHRLHIFPLMVAEMAKIGEETGTMPDVFNKISMHYQKAVSTCVERFVAAFEPIMIVVMGVLIGGLVISLYLPLFRIATFGGAV